MNNGAWALPIRQAAQTVDYVIEQLRAFEQANGYHPCLIHPARTLNEQVLLLKLLSSPDLSIYTDKIAVKALIQERIDCDPGLRGLRIPSTLSVYQTPEELAASPPRENCIIKANHGSGMVLHYRVDQGLSNADISVFRDWLATDYAVTSGERCYASILPTLFSERLLRCASGALPMDIKVHCVRGSILMTQLLDRTGTELRRLSFDANNALQVLFANEVLRVSARDVPLQLACQYASILAAEFEYVRVDFYWVDDCLYFSELTFYPMSAAMPLASFATDIHLGRAYRQAGRRTLNRNGNAKPGPATARPGLLVLMGYAAFCLRSPRRSLRQLLRRLRAQDCLRDQASS